MNKKLRIIFCIFLFAGLICGCSTTTPEVYETPTPTVAVTVQASVTPAEKKPGQIEPETEGDIRDVTITFTGDFFASPEMMKNYEKSGIEGVVSSKVLEKFRSSDIMVINHEYCATDLDESYKADYQRWIEHAPAGNEFILTELGVDLAMVANNHMFDYGREGFEDTLRGLNERGIKYVGAGFDYEDCTEPKIMRASNKSIAFLASNDVITRTDWIAKGDKSGMNALYYWSETYTEMVERVKEAKRCSDLVVVMLHFGTEKTNVFNKNQSMFARELIDAGADLIIGSHPHVLQGIEYYKNGIIFYSLGNFLFSNYRSDTMMVSVTLKQDNSFTAKILPCSSYIYYTKDVDDGKVFELLNTYSSNAYVDNEGNVKPKQ